MKHNLIFNAYGTDKFGTKYDCSFSVQWHIEQKMSQPEIQKNVDLAMAQFGEYHPTGVVTSHVKSVVP